MSVTLNGVTVSGVDIGMLTPSVVQAISLTATTTGLSFSYPAKPIAGNLLLIAMSFQQNRTPAISGWTSAYYLSTSLLPIAIFYKIATTAEPTSYSITWGGNNSNIRIQYLEITNNKRYNPITVYGDYTDTGVAVTTQILPETAIDIPARSLAIAYCATQGSKNWSAWTNSFTNATSATAVWDNMARRTYNTAALAQQTTATWDSGTQVANGAMIIIHPKRSVV